MFLQEVEIFFLLLEKSKFVTSCNFLDSREFIFLPSWGVNFKKILPTFGLGSKLSEVISNKGRPSNIYWLKTLILPYDFFPGFDTNLSPNSFWNI